MIPIYVTDLFSKTEKNNQNYLLKAEIKNITNCSSQRWDKWDKLDKLIIKWSQLCY